MHYLQIWFEGGYNISYIIISHELFLLQGTSISKLYMKHSTQNNLWHVSYN